MPVHPRGQSWQASVSYKRTRLRKDFPTKAAAELWEACTLADLRSGINPASPKTGGMTLAALKDHTFAVRWQGQKSAETAMQNASEVVRILGPERPAASLTRADAALLKDKLRDKGVSDATINRKLAAFSVMLKEAFDLGEVPRLFKVGISRERQHRVRFLTEDEEAAILQHCLNTALFELYDYLVVSIDTGFRQGELLKILCQDVGKENLWTYDTKAGTSREVPLTPRARAVLERRVVGLKPRDRVFPHLPQKYRDQWNAVLSALGLAGDADLVLHCTRHTFVTRLLAEGVDIKTVQELAGHENISTTQRYAHTSPERKVMAILRLAKGEAA